MLQFSAAFRCLEKHHRLAPFGYIGRCAAAKIFYRGFDEKSTREAALQQLFVQAEPRQAVFLRNKCWISLRKLQPRWKKVWFRNFSSSSSVHCCKKQQGDSAQKSMPQQRDTAWSDCSVFLQQNFPTEILRQPDIYPSCSVNCFACSIQ